MTIALIITFWTASFAVLYPYVVYPFLLRVLARYWPAPRVQRQLVAAELPSVTLIISAYNERAVIAKKIYNALSLKYVPDRLEIIVVSDASSDGTDEVVAELSSTERRVRLVRQHERRGKSAGLNRAVEVAKGAIVVFSDANALYETDAIQVLVREFSDPQVGYVVGAAHYSDSNGNRAAESEGLYWRFELLLKQLESDFHSVVGGDGAIYAIRRHLFRDLKDDDISDFVNPLQIVAAGYRGLFNSGARCYEEAGETFQKEFQRKRRIVNRSWRAVARYGGLLKRSEHGRFIFMLLSHKVIRWLALPFVGLAWAANTALLGVGTLYIFSWFIITASLALAAIGALLEQAGKRLPWVISILYYFYFVNLAGLLGIWDELRGLRHATWDHIRRSDS